MELTDRALLYDSPRHPYTQALLAAVPMPDPFVEETRAHAVLEGEVPSPLNPPEGCTFHPRCPHCDPACKTQVPQLREVAEGHYVSCLLA